MNALSSGYPLTLWSMAKLLIYGCGFFLSLSRNMCGSYVALENVDFCFEKSETGEEKNSIFIL